MHKPYLLFFVLGFVGLTAASQTHYKGRDEALSRTIQKALIDSELNITQNAFHLVAVAVKEGKLLSIEPFSNDTTGNFQIIRNTLLTATTGNWKRKTRHLVILIPFFFVKRNSEAPFTANEWRKEHTNYLKAEQTVLLSPIYFLSEGQKIRSQAP